MRSKRKNRHGKGRPATATMGKKVFNTAMAAAFALNPFANIAMAADGITKVDGNNNSIVVDGNVTNIYADQINKSTDVGINRFNSFKVDNIANLYFRTKGGTDEVNNLLNFVNGQINVSGTVNAIKDSKIGGNLYFFSTGGMVVSGSGVINAGQLVAASVSADYMTNIMKNINSGSDGNSTSNTSIFEASSDQITSFLNQTGLADTLVADIPANSSGTISVEGKINTAYAAKLMAGQIDVNNGGLIRSAIDFSEITRVGEADQKVIGENAKRLTLSKDEDGSIILQGVSAVTVGENSTVDADKNKVVIKAENSKTIDLSQASADKAKLLNWKEAQASATVNINGNVKGGDTEISAKATTKFTGNVFNAPAEEKKDDGAKTDGKTDGKATDSQETVGDKIVKAIEKTETGKKISNTAKNFFGKINVLMDESEASATVNIGKNAKVESTGQVDISATSSATNDLKITAQADVKNAKKDEKDTEKNSTISGQYLIGTAIYNKSVSNAAVNVEGTVTSTGAMNITADATNSSTVANKILKAKNASDSTQYMDAVVNVVADTTTAAVNIKEGSNVTSSDAVTMKAKTDSSLDVTGNVVTDNNAAAATALNIVASTTDAAVNVNGTVKGKSVEADAANKVSKLNITTSNAYEKASEAKKDTANADGTQKANTQTTNEAAAANEDGTTTAGGDGSSSGSGTDSSSGDSDAAPVPVPGESTEDYGQEDGDNVIDIDPAPPASSSSSEDGSAAEGLSELLKGNSSDSNNNSGLLGANKDADNKKSATSGDSEAVKDAKGTKDTDQAKDAENKSDSSTDAEKKKAEDKETKKTGWNQYFDIGASVMVGNFTNNATAKVGKTGSLTATGGDVTVKSDVEIAKGDIKVTNSIINTDAAAKFAVGAAVAVKNMHNDAAIVLENADEAHTALSATSGGVNMAATVSNQAAEEKSSDSSSTANGSTDSKTETKASGSMVVQSTMSSAVKKDDKDKDKDKDTNLPFAASGTVAIENTTSNANIYVGQNEQIKADKKASLTATLKGEDKLEAGKANKKGEAETTTSGAQVAVGGTAAVQNSYLNSKIEIANGAVIEAGHIDAKSTNTITNTVTSVGGTTTSKGGVDGMVAYMGGESNARVLVDNGATLTAKYTKAESTGKGDATDTTTTGTATNDTSADTSTDDKTNNTSATTDNSTDGKISLSTENNTTLTNKAGLTDKSDYVAVGASVGVVSYDLLSETKITGSDTTNQGTITAVALSAEASNDSTVKNSTVAGVTAGKSAEKKDDKSKDDKKADTKSSNDDASGTTLKVRDEKKSEGSDSSEKVEDVDKYSINSEGKEDKGSAAKVEDPAPTADSEVAKDSDGNADTQDKKKTEEQKKSNSTVNIAAAGSVSWNDVKTNAIAEIANVTLVGATEKAADDTTKVTVSASDTSTIKASSGASTLIEVGKEGDMGFSASLAGAVAGNDILKTTRAKISGVTMSNMDSVSNTAENNGTVWATGKSVGTGKKAAAGLTAVTSADVNYVTSNVDAIIEDSNINKEETVSKDFKVTNEATTMDTQIAGGLAYEKTKTSVAAGASVTINKLTNNINAQMTKGQIGNDKANAEVVNQAVTRLDQVGVASSIGVADGGAYLNANAAVAANTVKNNIDATIDGTRIYAAGEKGGVVVLAKDGQVENGDALKKYQEKIDKLKGEGYDDDFSDVTEALNADAEATEGNDDIVTKAAAWALEKYMALQNQGGNRIVTGALGLGITKNAAKSDSDSSSDTSTKEASSASLTAAASVAYSDITNNVTANIKNADIKATTVEANANTYSLMIDAAVGASVATTGKGITAAGSVAIQNLNNDTKALVENSTITTSQTEVKASNESMAITSAGQASGTDGALALGMGWAQNDIDNITSARINGSTINALDAALGTDLDVKADNTSKIYAVGIAAGVATGGETAGAVIDGAFAGNTGTNSTEAVVDQDSQKKKTQINKANKVAVEANSETTQKAIAGDASVKTGSSKFSAAIGGAVAINKLGSSSEHQSVKAAINNAEITTVKASKTTTADDDSTTTSTIDPSISVKALDNDNLMNIALGGAVKAGGNGVSVQGSVALSKLYKDSTATMDNASIKSASTSTTDDEAAVAVDAQSTGKITNSASGVSVSVGENVDVSAMAGVAVNNLEGTTKAAVTNSTQNVKDLSVKADSKREILNVGVGAETAVGSKAAVAVQGNVAVNKLDNDVQAEISGSTIEAANNVAVQANNTNVLKNYGGSINVAVSGTAGVGVGATVAVNTIEGDTKALVSGSNIKALGQGDAISTDEYAENTAADSKGTMSKKSVERKGLVISADSQQTLKNVSVTAGVSAAATAAVGANATVAVNKIAGETQALLENTNVNQNLAAGTAAGDVAILAHDSTEVNSTVGTLGVSGASTAAVAAGAAVDTNDFSRNTTAAIKGASDKNQAAINAKDLAVKSASSADLTLVEQGASVAIGATAGVAAVGTVSVNNFSGTTKSVVENAKVNVANDAAVEADTAKKSKIALGAYAVSGGYAAVSASAGVSVLNDDSTTQAALKNAEITSAAKDVQIAANNVNNLSNLAANVNVAVGIGAGVGTAVTVNNMNNTVATSLDGSVVTAKKGNAKASANNEMELHSTNAAASAGAGAVGVGVAVNNINSSTATTLTNSGIHADTIDIKADEKRTIDAQTVGLNVGAVAVGTNVNINNIGTTMAKEYSYGDGLKYSTEQITTKINDALEASEQAQADVAKSGYTTEASVASEAANSSSQVQGVSISMDQDVLQATNDVNIATNAITNGTVNMVGVTGSLAGVNVTVGVTDIKHNNQVAISNRSQISGGKVNISASSGGTIDQSVEQAGLAGGSVNVGVSKLLRSGDNTINISGGSVTATRDVDATQTTEDSTTAAAAADADVTTAKTTELNITVSDAAVLNNTVQGLNVSGATAGALVSNTEDKTNNTINITNGASLTSVENKTVNVDTYYVATAENGNKIQGHKQETEERPEYKDINITATSTTQANATSDVVNVAGVSGHGDIATATIGDANHSSANTAVNIGTNNKFKGSNLNVTSENNAAAAATVSATTIGAATGQGTTSNASVYGSSNTTVNNGNTILADAVNLNAINGMKAAANTTGVGVSGLGININQANAVVDGKTTLAVGNVDLQTSTWQEGEATFDTETRTVTKDSTTTEETEYFVIQGKGKEVTQEKGGTLKLVAQDNSIGSADIKGVSTGAVAFGTNIARTTANSNIDVKVITDTMNAQSLDIQAGSSLKTTARADNTSGGVINVDPRAASVENTTNSTTNVKLSGRFNLDENLRSEAINADQTGLMVDTLQVTAAGGGGTSVENNVNQKSYMDIASATINAGGTVEAGSGNKYTLSAAKTLSDKENNYILKGNGYGIAGNVQVGSITNNINNTAETKLGNVISDGDQKFWADTENDITSNAQVYAFGALMNGARLVNTMNVASNNKITQAGGTTLKTIDRDSNITIGANDKENLTNKSLSENAGGLSGGVSAESATNVTRNNKLDLAGNIYSRKDVNLYAGKSVDEQLGSLQMTTYAEVYNGSFIPIYFNPTVTNIQNQNNIINISGKVQSVQDANLYADAGKEIFSTFSGTFTGYGGGATPTYVAKTNGNYNVDKHDQEVASKTYDNHVEVTGSVTAGVASDQSITIGETGWVLLTPEQYAQCKAYYDSKNQAMPDKYYAVVADADYAATMAEYGLNSNQIKKLSDVVKINDAEAAGINVSDFTLGTYSYAESLINRLSELSQLMAEYSQASQANAADTKQTAAFIGYQAEYQRVSDLLKQSGMLDGEGNVVKDVAINYIDIPDLAASGGNINVITDDLYGSGSLTAKGTPSIKVENNTSLALNVNNVTVSNPGGQVYFNNTAMEKKEDIAAANRNKGKTIGSLSVAKGTAGSVEITSNLTPASSVNTDTIHYRIDDQDIHEDRENPIKADINIAGSITAQGGDVTVRNHNFDISIYSGGSSAHAISAKNIYLIADKGSLTQSYTEGISNVGGDPKDQYKDDWDTTDKYSGSSGAIKITKNYTNEKHAGDIQGDNIFLNASDVNINGFVQSGYDNYYVNISESTILTDSLQLADSTDTTSKMTVAARMTEIENSNKANDLSNSSVLGNDSYCLVKGGARYNSEKKYYEYVVPVYYNPVTKELLTPDVESKGGNITITGRISSTGAGNIICLDGASDININSELDKTLITSKLVTNDVEGKIRINDTGRGFATEITRGDSADALNYKIYSLYATDETDESGNVIKHTDAGTLLYDSSDTEKYPNGWNGVAADGKAYLSKDTNNEIAYTPKEGLRYNWTTGKQTGKTNTYSKTYYNSWWGLSDSESDLRTDLVNSETTPETSTEGDTKAKTDGSYIGTTTDGNISSDTILYVNKDYKESGHSIKIIEQKKWSQGFLGCHKYTMTRWTDTFGQDYTNNYSLKADNPISIKFIGSASGDSQVNITTQGNLQLAGDIGNKNLYNINDTNGGISSLEHGLVNITAGGNIVQTGGSIYGNTVSLSSGGNMQNIDITAGDILNLSAINTNTASVSKNIDIVVEGNRGANGDVIIMAAGQDDADSDGRRETDSFKLTTKGKTGNIISGNTNTDDTTAQVPAVINAERIDLISNNGYIEANVNAGQQPIDADTLSASVNAQAQGNITLTQTTGDMRVGRVYAKAGDVTVNVNQGSVVDALPYGTLEADDENALLAKWRSMGLLEVVDETSVADKDIADAKDNVVKKATYTWDADKKEWKVEKAADNTATRTTWDKNTLLYTISDSILNTTTDALQTSDKDPNLKGNNITINVANSAGLDSDTVTTINSSQLSDLSKLKELSRADGSTVTVANHMVGGKEDGTVDFTITQRLPIGVQTNSDSGTLTIGKITTGSTVGKADGNAYIQGRVDSTDNNANKDLALKTIQVNGNVSIESLGNIINGSGNDAIQNIIAQNLNITAANKGFIGTLDTPITTDLGSTTTAGTLRAVGNGIYINNTGANNIAIQAVSSSGDIDISATKDIQMTVKQNLPGVAETYIQVENENNTINLTSREGSVGTVSTTNNDEIEYDENGKPKTSSIRIKNSANGKTKVNIQAAKDVAVEGMSNDPTGKNASGYLNLTVNAYNNNTGDKKLENIAIDVNGTLMSDQDMEADKTITITTAENLDVKHSLTAGEQIYLDSNKDVAINGGNVEATGDSSKVLVKAGNDITVTNGTVKGTEAQLSAANDIKLVSGTVEANKMQLIAGKNLQQAAASALKVTGDAGTLSAESTGEMQLLGVSNALGNATLNNKRTADGNDIIINNGSGNATITLNNSADSSNIAKGNVKLTNTDADATLTINNVRAEKDLTINSAGNAKVAKQVKDNDKVTVEGLAKGTNVTINAGKNIDIAGDIMSGTNDGNTLTMVSEQGNVVTEEGSSLLGHDMYLNSKGDYSQDSSIGLVSNAATILATGDVTLKSDHGNVSVDKAIGSAKKDEIEHVVNNIYLLAENGAVLNTDTIYAAESVNIKSKQNFNIAKEIVAGKDINIESTAGSLANTSRLLSVKGNVYLTADNGHVFNSTNGDIFALGGNVVLSAYGDKTEVNIKPEGMTEKEKASVINYGDIMALDTNADDKASAGYVILHSEKGDVYNNNDMNHLTGTTSTGKIQIASDGKHITYDNKTYTVALNNIVMSAENGKLETSKDLLHAGGNVSLVAKEGLNSLGEKIYAGGDIILRATDGNMVNKAAIESVNGSVTLIADKGTVVNMLSGDILAGGGDVVLQAGAETEASHQIYAIGADGKTTAVSGINLPEEYATAVIKSHKYYKEGDTYVLITDKTDVGKLVQEKATIYTTAVYVDKNGNDVDLHLHTDGSTAITITVDGKELTAMTGDIEFVRTGDALNRGDLIAMGVDPVETTADSITGYKSTVPGTITISSAHGNVINYDNFAMSDGGTTYDGAYTLTKDEHGYDVLTETGKKYLLANGNIALKAPEGNFYNDFSISTDADLELSSKGDMVIGNNFSIENVGGNMTFTSTEGSVTNGANSKVTAGKDITINAAKGVNNFGELEARENLYITNNSTEDEESEINSTGKMTALNGSIDVVNKYGKIDIDSMMAKEDAAASTGRGDVIIGDITGGRVILSTDGEGNAITMGQHTHSDGTTVDGKLTVDTYVGLHGDYITNKVQPTHGDNYSGTIIFDITGSKGSEVKGNLEVENDGHSVFETLHVTDADINITNNSRLDADKIRVHGNALLHVFGKETAIFGSQPNAVKAQYAYGDLSDWMKLNIFDGNHQYSNGILVHHDGYHYVTNQRYSSESLSRQYMDFKADMDNFRYNSNPIRLFDRYNVYETYDFTPSLPIQDDDEENSITVV